MSEEDYEEEVPDLYHILGLTIDVCQNENCQQIIKNSYNKKVIACHPDKFPGKEEMVENFELLTEAYQILKDEKLREKYNSRLKNAQHKFRDFSELKKDCYEHLKNIPDVHYDKNFDELTRELNEKHGITQAEKNMMKKEEYQKMIDQMEKERVSQDAEFQQSKIFEDENFDIEKFNAAFDLINDDRTIIPKEDPTPWMNHVPYYAELQQSDNLYLDSFDQDNCGNYGPVLSKEQKKLETPLRYIPKVEYVKNHAKKDKDYYQDLKSRLSQYKNETKELHFIKKDDHYDDIEKIING